MLEVLENEEILYLFVKVPHFSEHTITISSLAADVVDALGGLSAMMYYLAICIVTVGVFVGIIYIRKRL